MPKTKSGTDHVGPADLEVSDTSVQHERNRELRREYLELEAQANDPTTSETARRRIQVRRRRVLDQVVQENQKLVHAFVNRFVRTKDSVEDYRQDGYVALLEAFQKWDPDGAPFASFAWNHVKGRVHRSVHSNEHAWISYGDWTAIPEIRHARTALAESLDHEPSAEEIAEYAQLTTGVVERATAPRPASLDAVFSSSDNESSLYDVTSDDEGPTERDLADTTEVVPDDDVLRRVTVDVPDRALAVWLLRSGFAGVDELDYGLVAFITGIDRETCRHLHQRAEQIIVRARPQVEVPPTPLEDPQSVVDRYRRDYADEFRPTLEQLVGVCQGIVELTPARTTAEQVGLTYEQLIEVVSQLGTWLARSAKDAGSARIVPVEETRQNALHQPFRPLPVVSAPRRKVRVAQESLLGTSETPPVPRSVTPKKRTPIATTDHVVLIPTGYRRGKGQSRDIRRALATVATRPPSRTTLVRFLSRVYPDGSPALRGETVYLVWRFATLGRLANFEKVNTSPRFLRSVVEAYDLLASALDEARTSLALLCDLRVTSPAELEHACATASFVAERDVARCRQFLTEPALLQREREHFAARVRANPAAYVLTHVRDLHEGRVRRIIAAHGLNAEQFTHRDRSTLRARIAELGLASDIDQLLPQALNASLLGETEEFFSILHQRLDGDPDWQQRLSTLLTSSRVTVPA